MVILVIRVCCVVFSYVSVLFVFLFCSVSQLSQIMHLPMNYIFSRLIYVNFLTTTYYERHTKSLFILFLEFSCLGLLFCS